MQNFVHESESIYIYIRTKAFFFDNLKYTIYILGRILASQGLGINIIFTYFFFNV